MPPARPRKNRARARRALVRKRRGLPASRHRASRSPSPSRRAGRRGAASAVPCALLGALRLGALCARMAPYRPTHRLGTPEFPASPQPVCYLLPAHRKRLRPPGSAAPACYRPVRSQSFKMRSTFSPARIRQYGRIILDPNRSKCGRRSLCAKRGIPRLWRTTPGTLPCFRLYSCS